MSTEKELYRRWINELWAGKPVAADVVSDDFVGHWPDRDVHGPTELQAIIEQTRAMFTKVEFTITLGPIAEGDLVAARWVGAGTTSEGQQRFTGNDILRFADGRFVEYWTGTSAG
jgi:predicted SnoaL-like aldol condensation-catalyzing enzyme